MNEKLFYPNGYDISVLSQDNKPLPFTVNKLTKNYLQIGIEYNGEVEVTITPKMKKLSGTIEKNELSVQWSLTEQLSKERKPYVSIGMAG